MVRTQGRKPCSEIRRFTTAKPSPAGANNWGLLSA
jgi:hypothetical protein